uniref:Uncharacterized protein n=1 Tax=Quercus lobata TaxID=97700 RepID=A0A7N2RA29_QUELO
MISKANGILELSRKIFEANTSFEWKGKIIYRKPLITDAEGNKIEDSQDGSNFGIDKRDNEMKIMGKLENSQEHDHKELDEIYKGVITNSFSLQNIQLGKFSVAVESL